MPQRSESDTIQLKARMKEPLRAKLEAAAEARGVSMNAELVDRLEASFDAEKDLGGARNYALFKMLAGAAAFIQEQQGHPWHDDWDTAQAVLHAWREIIDWAASRVRTPSDVKAVMELKKPEEPEAIGTLIKDLMGPNTMRNLLVMAGAVELSEADLQKVEELEQLLAKHAESVRSFAQQIEGLNNRIEEQQDLAQQAVLGVDMSALSRSG